MSHIKSSLNEFQILRCFNDSHFHTARIKIKASFYAKHMVFVYFSCWVVVLVYCFEFEMIDVNSRNSNQNDCCECSFHAFMKAVMKPFNNPQTSRAVWRLIDTCSWTNFGPILQTKTTTILIANCSDLLPMALFVEGLAHIQVYLNETKLNLLFKRLSSYHFTYITLEVTPAFLLFPWKWQPINI